MRFIHDCPGAEGKAGLLILGLILGIALPCGWARPALAQTKPAAAPKAKTEPKAEAKTAPSKEQKAAAAAEAAKKRAKGLAALAARLGIGQGKSVADIGAGGGADTWTWAEIVGPSGTVYAEEINEKQVKGLEKQAAAKKLSQVRPVLGRVDDPALPKAAVDLAYMRFVYHHVSKPREMLRGIWRALKPGGYLVVIDRNRGTLRDWVPREQRKSKHFWLAETTVVREAREEGFLFVICAEEFCEAPEPFVLVFQRPKDLQEPGTDPDRLQPLAADAAERLLPQGARFQRPVLIALGEARGLMRPILDRSGGQGLEIVLEEWAAQKDERPPLPAGASLPSVMTDLGDPRLGPEPIDAVFFLDTYHLLFHGKTLLSKLRQRLASDACVYVLDREARQAVSRREASHRRQIDPKTVKEEMAAAGFALLREGPCLAPDRFLLVFRKTQKH